MNTVLIFKQGLSCPRTFWTKVTFASLKNGWISKPGVCFRTSVSKRTFSSARVRHANTVKSSKSTNADKSSNTINGSNSKSERVPKLSELRRLMKAAYPERWKIAGEFANGQMISW